MFNRKVKFYKNRGFTLIETLISISIFVIIMVGVSTFARNIYYYNNVFSNGLTSYDDARKVLQPIASEIRSASPSSLGSYPIEKTGDTEFIFYTDIDNNGSKERIRYFLLGNILKRGVTVPSGSPLQYLSANETITDIIKGIRNIPTNPVFIYFDTNYNGTSQPLLQPISIMNVRLVKINLSIDEDPSRPPSAISVSTQVSIRNLKDNL